MSDLLPLNSTEFERALAGAMSRISEIPSPLRDLWRPDTCPVDFLPWLAWALSVDEWDPSWSEERKRAQVADSLKLHMKKGTPWAVKTALESISWPVVALEEGLAPLLCDGSFSYNGENTYCASGRWALFRATFDLSLGGITPAQEAQIRRVIDNTRPARSTLERIKGAVGLVDGAGAAPVDGPAQILTTTWHLYDGSLSFDGSVTYSGDTSLETLP